MVKNVYVFLTTCKIGYLFNFILMMTIITFTCLSEVLPVDYYKRRHIKPRCVLSKCHYRDYEFPIRERQFAPIAVEQHLIQLGGLQEHTISMKGCCDCKSFLLALYHVLEMRSKKAFYRHHC